MPLLNDKVKADVRKALEAMTGPVKLVVFSQESGALECEFCTETRELMQEIAELSDKISVQVHDFADTATAESYQVDKIPAVAIIGERDYGVRFYGIPSGYEFSSIIDDIISVSKGDSGLTDKTKTEIAKINQPVHIQVYVTPT